MFCPEDGEEPGKSDEPGNPSIIEEKENEGEGQGSPERVRVQPPCFAGKCCIHSSLLAIPILPTNIASRDRN